MKPIIQAVVTGLGQGPVFKQPNQSSALIVQQGPAYTSKHSAKAGSSLTNLSSGTPYVVAKRVC